MLRFIAILIIVAIVIILILARLKPDTFHVERSARIQAPPEKIFAYINDLRIWAAWSTWERMDPDMRKTFSEGSSGKGASYEWEGNRKVGHGRMTIVESVAPSRIVIQLDFFAPFEAHNMASLTLQAQGNGTLVTWAMYGPSPFIAKLFGVFVSMDRMVGKDFEDSLSNLKVIAENLPSTSP
ncbi:MAG TPA: SRPBCC family protein [Gallionella sp.]